jgi:hypothetical protein
LGLIAGSFASCSRDYLCRPAASGKKLLGGSGVRTAPLLPCAHEHRVSKVGFGDRFGPLQSRFRGTLDRYIRKERLEPTYELTTPSIYVEQIKLTEKEMQETARQKNLLLAPGKRKKNFREFDSGLERKAAIKDAKRCLRCDLDAKEAREKEVQ